MPDEDEYRRLHQEVKRITRGAADFVAALKAQQIHVGVGSPPRCVTCEVSWPCEHG